MIDYLLFGRAGASGFFFLFKIIRAVGLSAIAFTSFLGKRLPLPSLTQNHGTSCIMNH